MRHAALFLALPLCLAAQSSGASRSGKAPVKKAGTANATAWVTTKSGLKYQDTQVGTGAAPRKGQTCVVHYTGWLSLMGQKGRKFDSSLDGGEPLAFPVGVGRVIAGWDEGLLTMKVGGRRTLVIPASLGYGAQGAGADIPPNSELIFEVALLGVR